MKFNRIYAIILRNLFAYKRSLDRLTDAFYWPTLDLIIWGLTSQFFSSGNGSLNFVSITISAIVIWLFLWRAQYEISINVVDELWNKNLVNLFGSPLKFSEWIASFLILGFIKIIMSVGFAMGLAYLLYKVEIFSLGFYLIPFMVLLILNGWVLGFIVSGLILSYGSKVQTLVWVTGWAISPFCAIYYPVSTLPEWAQKIAYFTPPSYIFEGMRQVINEGKFDLNKLIIPTILTLVYLVLSLIYVKGSFNKLMNKGLVRAF